MRLMRSMGRRRRQPWPGLAAPAEDHPEEMPPGPQRAGPGPVTTPRLFTPMGPVAEEWDPCGRPGPRLKISSDEGGTG